MIASYWMLHTLGHRKSVSQHIVLVPAAPAPLSDSRMVISDLNTGTGACLELCGEHRAPEAFRSVLWQRRVTMHYCIAFHAGDRSWRQDLQLRRHRDTDLWVSATRLQETAGEDLLRCADAGYLDDFGEPNWTCTPSSPYPDR